ncbi:MAG: hypothetical protein JHC61_10220 [Burkholderiaceae bacterium]|nr:hypothetical protein [Burkholderiaceae bacterium]
MHIAPASIQTLGLLHARVDLDVVLNLLAMHGQIPGVTTEIPNYWSRPPELNGRTDIFGHGLLEIYLNKKLAAFERIVSGIDYQVGRRSLRSQTGIGSYPALFTIHTNKHTHRNNEIYLIGPTWRDDRSINGSRSFCQHRDNQGLEGASSAKLGVYTVRARFGWLIPGENTISARLVDRDGVELITKTVTFDDEEYRKGNGVLFSFQVLRDPVTMLYDVQVLP